MLAVTEQAVIRAKCERGNERLRAEEAEGQLSAALRERDEARESVEALERGFSDLNDGCVALPVHHRIAIVVELAEALGLEASQEIRKLDG
jgi:DNA-binding IclR family transcriptional regulator